MGDLEDWYSDARFVQQHFTGTNPTTIEQASQQWITHFTSGPKGTADKKAQQAINALARNSQRSLYMQDYSYFHEAAESDGTADIKCKLEETYKEGGNSKTRKSYRYGCASVCPFYLNDDGTLQPLAIIIDCRGSAEASVTIYNRQLIKRDANLQSPAAEKDTYDEEGDKIDEDHDWAWRYGECSDIILEGTILTDVI